GRAVGRPAIRRRPAGPRRRVAPQAGPRRRQRLGLAGPVRAEAVQQRLALLRAALGVADADLADPVVLVEADEHLRRPERHRPLGVVQHQHVQPARHGAGAVMPAARQVGLGLVAILAQFQLLEREVVDRPEGARQGDARLAGGDAFAALLLVALAGAVGARLLAGGGGGVLDRQHRRLLVEGQAQFGLRLWLLPAEDQAGAGIALGALDRRGTER